MGPEIELDRYNELIKVEKIDMIKCTYHVWERDKTKGLRYSCINSETGEIIEERSEDKNL